MQAAAAFASRLQLTDAPISAFEPAELVAEVQPKLPQEIQLDDRTAGVPTTDDDFGAILSFVKAATTDATDEQGRRLIYIQRTEANANAFNLIFALVKYGEQLIGSQAPLRFAPPGWLAWCRDDYFFATSAYDLPLSSRVLIGFALGTSECCICLEAMFEERPSIGLECGHIVHTDCLSQALHSRGSAQLTHTCPLCRHPFTIAPDGSIVSVPENVAGVISARQRDDQMYRALSAREVELDTGGVKCCAGCVVM
jgi:hypothetical protein